MQFIYPEFLYALAFLLIPIIIHLFNFKRYKTIYFPDVSFLKSIKQRSQSTSKIKHLLVLICRMLLLASIVIAFAQPYFKEEGEVNISGKKGIQIYLDNSFSMQSQSNEGSLFNLAKQRAYTIINSYSASDKFQVITNEFTNQSTLWLNKEAAIDRIQSVEIQKVNRTLKDVVFRLEEAESNEIDQKLIYLISDFQRNNFDLDQVDSLETEINLIILNALENDNISIQELKFEKPFHLPGQSEKLEVKFIRHGATNNTKVPVQLFLEDQLRVPISVEFGKEDTLLAEMSFQSGNNYIQSGFISIKDYPINYDDTLFFNYDLKKKISILHIYENQVNSFISALFSEDSLYDYTAIDPNQINYSELENISLIVLDELNALSSGTIEAFVKYVRQGGNVLLIPNDVAESSINALLSRLNTTQLLDLQENEMKLGEINRNSILFEGVFESIPKNLDLPKVDNYWLLSENSNSIREDLLLLKNGNPFLRKYEVEEGNLYLFTSSLSSSNNTFGRHALFVPTLYNIALYSQEKDPLYYSLDEDLIVLENIEPSESPVHLIGYGVDLIPQQEYRNGGLRLKLNHSIQRAGHYELIREGEKLGMLSLNYDRSESDFDLMTEKEIVEFTTSNDLKIRSFTNREESLNQAIQSSTKGISLWKYFIILALLFLGIEIALLRILK